MAILDAELTFSETLDLGAATSGSVTASSNIFDLGTAVGRDLGVNFAEQLVFQLICKESFNEAMAGASLTIKVVSDSVAPLDGSSNVHWTSPALDTTLASATFPLIEGNEMLIPFPVGGGLDPDILQFIGLTFTVASQNLSAGMFDIHMAKAFHRGKAFTTGMNFV